MDLLKSYIGVVVDNTDPRRLGRVKVNVFSVYDSIPTEYIPYASPKKDLNGEEFRIPEVGKVVAVEFENGNINCPLYIYAENYNINLLNKLKSISDRDYKEFKTLLFNDITQIYSSPSEGVKIDHKFNNVNVNENGIDLNLKDNTGEVNIGSNDANQQAILGNNFFEWFSKFLDTFINGTGLFGNLLAPIVPQPIMVELITSYKALLNEKFLSHNIRIVDNGYVNKLDRININQKGDKWTSRKFENTYSIVELPRFSSTDIIKGDTPSGKLTPEENYPQDKVNIVADSYDEVNPDVVKIIKVLKSKNYIVYTEPFKVNLVGVRTQYKGDVYSNKFVDKLYVFYINDKGKWVIKNYNISTIPGTRKKITQEDVSKGVPIEFLGKKISLKKWCSYLRPKGLGILVPAQYINIFQMGEFAGERALKARDKQLVYRDKSFNDDRILYEDKPQSESVGMHLHKAFPSGLNVDNWSEGCQVLPSKKIIDSLFEIFELHRKLHGNIFTYTLITSRDMDSVD